MIIKELQIDRYGPFEDTLIGPLSRGLNIIYGPNEAGKSALRAFIRMVLFNRMRTNAPEARRFNYIHSGGDTGSGAIVLDVDGEQFRIHRSEGKPPEVTGPQSGGQDLLYRLTGRIDDTLYRNVFSVSLTELERLDLLSDEQVRERIHSAGLGLASVSLSEITDHIDSERASSTGLWSPRAGRLREGIKKLAERSGELERLRAEQANYETIGSDLDSARVDVERQDLALKELRTGQARLVQLRILRLPWEQLRELRQKLAALPDVSLFPEDGLDRLADLESEIKMLEERLEEGTVQNADASREIGRAGVVPSFGQQEGEITRLLEEVGYYERATADLPGLREKRTPGEQELADGLSNLGTIWDESRLVAFTEVAEARNALNTAGEFLDGSKGEMNRMAALLEERARLSAVDRGNADDAHRNAIAAGEAPDLNRTDLDARRERLELLRATLDDIETLEREQREQPSSRGQFSFGNPGLWLAGSIMALIAGLIALAVSLSLPAGLLLGSAAVIGAVGIAVLVRRRATNTESTYGNTTVVVRLQTANSEAGALAHDLDFDTTRPEQRIVADELNRTVRLIERRRDADDAERLEIRATMSEKDTDHARGLREISQSHAEQMHIAWTAALHKYDLQETLDRASAGNAIGRIATLRAELGNLNQWRTRIAGIEARVVPLDEALARVLSAAELQPAAPEHGTAALRDLGERFQLHRDASARVEALRDQQHKWETQAKRYLDRLHRIRGEFDDLIEKSSVQNADSFRVLGRVQKEHRSYEARMQDLELVQPLLISEEGESHREDLRRWSEEEVEARLQQAADEIGELETSLNQLRGDARLLAERRTAMEQEDPLESIQWEIGNLTEQVRSDAARWAVLTIARHALDGAIDEFRQQRQAPLFRAASGYFEALTEGEYVSVNEALGDRPMDVVPAIGAPRQIDRLSRGTTEQLFLALRFALIDEYGAASEPMPVSMDDVMVNFDPGRGRAAASAVVQLAARHQVILLTCHPHLVEWIMSAARAEAAESPTVIQLDRGGQVVPYEGDAETPRPRMQPLL